MSFGIGFWEDHVTDLVEPTAVLGVLHLAKHLERQL